MKAKRPITLAYPARHLRWVQCKGSKGNTITLDPLLQNFTSTSETEGGAKNTIRDYSGPSAGPSVELTHLPASFGKRDHQRGLRPREAENSRLVPRPVGSDKIFFFFFSFIPFLFALCWGLRPQRPPSPAARQATCGRIFLIE